MSDLDHIPTSTDVQFSDMMQRPVPVQWLPSIATSNGSATSAVNLDRSSRRGCPRNSVLTEVCGIVKESKVLPGEAPRFHGSKGTQKYECCLCGKTFSRMHTVKIHFVACVNKNGNPEGKCWNEHPSLSRYAPRKVTSQYQLDRASYRQSQASGFMIISYQAPVPQSGIQTPHDGPTSVETPPIDPALGRPTQTEPTLGWAPSVGYGLERPTRTEHILGETSQTTKGNTG